MQSMSTCVRTAALLVIAAVAHAADARPTPTDGATPAIRSAEFNARVAQYVALHDRAAATVRIPKSTDDAAQLVARREALAAAVRTARPNARQGDVFTPATEREIRSDTRADLNARPPSDRAAVREEVPQLPFAVNGSYPPDAPLATVPPILLATLPRLPEEVEYRFFARHLILLDVDANLIVDYIPNVLPPAK